LPYDISLGSTSISVVQFFQKTLFCPVQYEDVLERKKSCNVSNVLFFQYTSTLVFLVLENVKFGLTGIWFTEYVNQGCPQTWTKNVHKRKLRMSINCSTECDSLNSYEAKTVTAYLVLKYAMVLFSTTTNWNFFTKVVFKFYSSFLEIKFTRWNQRTWYVFKNFTR